MARDLKGVMPALLTPFDSQQRLDIESLRRLVRFNIGQGSTGCMSVGLRVRHLSKTALRESRYWKLLPKKRKAR